MALYNLRRNIKTKPQARIGTASCRKTSHLEQTVEYLVLIALGDADTKVLHADLDALVLCPAADDNPIGLRRELDGICDEVGQHLSDAIFVTNYPTRCKALHDYSVAYRKQSEILN